MHRGDHNLVLEPGAGRRNRVTRGVPLGTLVGLCPSNEGGAMRGVEIGIRGIPSPLIRRSGPGVQIREGGQIAVADPIAEEL